MQQLRICPICQRLIPIQNLLLAATIGRSKCAHCLRSLQGNGYVLALAIAQGMVLGGGLMALIVLGLLWIVVEVVIGILVLLFLICICAWILTWFHGSFSVVGRDYLEPKAIRIHFLATAVTALLLVFLVSFYVGFNLVVLVSVVAWVMVPMVVFYPNYRHLANEYSRSTSCVLLSVWAGTVCFAIVGFLIYAIPNFPKSGKFTDYESITPGPVMQQEVWDINRRLLDEFDLRFRNDLIYAGTALQEHNHSNERVRTLISSTARPRNGILNIFADNATSLPSSVSLANPVPRYGILLPISRIELSEIKQLAATDEIDNHKMASEKYLRLWALASQMLNGEDLFDKQIVAMSLIIDLVNFYIESEVRGTLFGNGLLIIHTKMIEQSLDMAFQSGVDMEFLVLRNTLLNQTEALCTLEPGVVCRFELPWPFFDKEKAFRDQFEFLAEVKRLSDSRLYEIKDEMDDLTDTIHTRLGRSYFINPVGPLANSVFPLVDGLIIAKETVRAHILAFDYFIGSSSTGLWTIIPNDPLTGEPFTVDVTEDLVTISSRYEIGGQYPIDYRIAR